jgi:ribonuclease HI
VTEDALSIFVDGSCLSHPRRGGIGIRYVWINNDGNDETSDLEIPGFKNATNNKMEVYACVVALREATTLSANSACRKIVIYTDSTYVVQNYKRAMFDWPRTGWRKAGGSPVLNALEWKDLVKEIRSAGKRVDFQWVKGHSGNVHNRAADKLAKRSAKNPLSEPLSVVGVRRKLTALPVERSSVPMEGQRASVRIIASEYLPVQRTNKYTYEVMSKSSKYRGRADVCFSVELMKQGHTYRVRFNKNQENPMILEMFGETKR